MLVFQHIPKTAGTTWRGIAYRQYPDNSVCPVYEDDDYYYSRKEFLELPEARRRGFRLLIGHFGPDIAAALPAGTPHRFATLLRPALERCVSHIHHVANFQLKGQPVTVEKLISDRYDQIDNLQVRLLCAKRVPFGEVTEAMVEEALARLKGYAFVGLTHRFRESYALAIAQLGWHPVSYAKRNTANDPERAIAVELSEHDLERLRELNRWDALLLEHAERLFGHRVGAAYPEPQWSQVLNAVRECERPAAELVPASEGGLGEVSAKLVHGWARLEQSDEAAVVDIRVGDKKVARIRAADPRPVLKDRGVEPGGRCGFEFAFPPELGQVDPASVSVRVVQSNARLDPFEKSARAA